MTHLSRPCAYVVHALILILLFPVVASAQLWDMLTAPKVSVRITHPPSLHMKITRLAMAPATRSDCTDELYDKIGEDLSQSQIDVLDRQHMEDIFAENRLTADGSADSASATRLGKLTGAAAMVYLKVSTCKATTRTFTERSLTGSTVFVSQTGFRLKGSVRLTDLTTGKSYTRTFDLSPHRELRSSEGYPSAISEDEMRAVGIEEATQTVHRMLLPWTEVAELYFFNDKECGIRPAFDSLRAGDNEGAFQKAKQSAESCPTTPGMKPKTIGHAYYNLGIAHFIRGDYDQALASLDKANQLIPGAIVTESMANCRRAKQLAAEAERVENTTAMGDEAPQSPAAASASKGAGAKSSSAKSAPATATPEERLKKLDALYKKGLITFDEYKKKKADILNDL